jgi:hypothetical protein
MKPRVGEAKNAYQTLVRKPEIKNYVRVDTI